MTSFKNIAILGGGNIGLSIAKGIQNSKLVEAKNIYITRRKIGEISEASKKIGFKVTSNNKEAVDKSEVIIIAVQPQQLNELLSEICERYLNPKKHLINFCGFRCKYKSN